MDHSNCILCIIVFLVGDQSTERLPLREPSSLRYNSFGRYKCLQQMPFEAPVPTAMTSSFSDTRKTINKFFKSLCEDSLTTTQFRPNAVLLVGPPGTGKTALVHDCASQHNLHLSVLTPAQLSQEHIGIVETNILTAFSAKQTADDTRPSVIFIDDLDIWAPSRITTAADNRIIATLIDAIRSLWDHNRLSSCALAFIATASSASDVHSSLIRHDVITDVLTLTALSYSERLTWCENALKSLFRNQSHDFQSCSHHLASITPGFLHADMVRFFTNLLRERQSTSFPEAPAQLILSPLLRHVSRSFTPALLSNMNPMLASITNATSTASSLPLTDLEDQIAEVKQCLTAVFTVHAERNLPTTHSPTTVRALGNLRTLSGLLIHGPTGCGKSALLQQATQMLPENAVNIIPVDSASIVSSVIGQAERNLSSLFSVARTIAPTAILIDNIDIIAPCRNRDTDANTSSSSNAFNRLLSTLLTEIDGVRDNAASVAVLVIATTRSLQLLDPALLRPGRFDMHIAVDLPDAQTRLNIIQNMCPSLSFSEYDSFDPVQFQQDSDGWTTADVLAYGRQKLLRSQH